MKLHHNGPSESKKSIYSESLDKTKSPQKNLTAQHIRMKYEGVGCVCVCVCVSSTYIHGPTNTTLKFDKENVPSSKIMFGFWGGGGGGWV